MSQYANLTRGPLTLHIIIQDEKHETHILKWCHTGQYSNYRLHKPVSDWLETLQNIRTEYVREIPIGHK